MNEGSLEEKLLASFGDLNDVLQPSDQHDDLLLDFMMSIESVEVGVWCRVIITWTLSIHF